MAQPSALPKKHHYVPQFLLKNFASSEREQIHVYDKRTEKTFCTHVRNVAAENGLYDLQLPSGIVSAESSLSTVECAAANVINKLLANQNIQSLSGEDKIILGLFTAVQMVRVPHQIEIMVQMTESIRDKWGDIPDMPRSELEARKQAREALVKNLSVGLKLLPELLNKTWLLLKSSERSSFYISDNPVTMHNTNRNPFRGTLGLGVKGIEVYIPLSSGLTLAFFCNSKKEGWIQSKVQFELAKSLGFKIPETFAANQTIFSEITRALEDGKPVQLCEKITNFQNELQVWNSERFIFSKKEDFDIVKQSMKKTPAFKKGPRLAGS